MVAKKTAAVRKRVDGKNWIAHLCETLVVSDAMPPWEAATYLTENLFGQKPNPRLLTPTSPHEITAQFFHRLYQPIADAASRDVTLPSSSKVHVFTHISLTGHSAILVVFFPDRHRPQQLLLFDAVKAWDLVFPNAESFNVWAEERYRHIVTALRAALVDLHDEELTPAIC